MNRELDWPRIAHLMKIGIAAAMMVLAGDMLLGWGMHAGWISIGNLWMFGGLLAMMIKANGGSGNEEQETK